MVNTRGYNGWHDPSGHFAWSGDLSNGASGLRYGHHRTDNHSQHASGDTGGTTTVDGGGIQGGGSTTTGSSGSAASTSSSTWDSVQLTRHDGPIVADHPGQVIENLDIYVDSGTAVTLNQDNVTLKNCRIHYNDAGTSGAAMGVYVNANGVKIENVEVIDSGAPASGPERNSDHYNIMAENAQNLQISDATLRDGSTGVYLLNSPGAMLEGIEGYNMRGPFPRGQLVQFDKSPNGTLQDFYVYNDPKIAYTEDNVSVYQSDNVTVQRGVIDGNNSPSGVGVMYEGSNNGHVSHVDAIHMGNGAFSAWDSNNDTFDYTRSFDNIAGNQGRGTPSSGGVEWTLVGNGNTISNSSYENPAVPNNIVWSAESTNSHVDVTQVSDTAPQAHWANHLIWSV